MSPSFKIQSHGIFGRDAATFPAMSAQRPGRVSGWIAHIAAKLTARLETARERREIAAMGPFARQELHALLVAQGNGGIPEHLWSSYQRAADAEALWPTPADRSGRQS
jgi:hypothetical protein